MGGKLTFLSVVWKENGWYVAWFPDPDIASQGRTVEGALKTLKEAI
jgi:predicted RNase H-like HicB family nuclease